jgi:hypothetical protein
MTGLIAELKSRNVSKVVVTWLLIQVSDTAALALHLPEWSVSFIALI